MNRLLIILLFVFAAGIFIIPINAVAQTLESFTDDYVWQVRFNKFKADAEKGDIEAQYKIGEMYEKGRGTSVDLDQAIMWYKKASEEYHMKAQYRLGSMYYRGIGVPIDKAKAFPLLLRPAAHDNTRAQYYIGRLYATGQGVAKDPQKALTWFRRSSLGGFQQAKILLGESNTEYGKPLQAMWMKHEKPATFLPSITTGCVQQSSDVIECLSDELKSKIGAVDITYVTKSILFDIKRTGDFKVAYRNKILNIDKFADESVVNEESDEGENVTAKVAVKKGWQETEHKLDCKVEDDQYTIKCLKNEISIMKFDRYVDASPNELESSSEELVMIDDKGVQRDQVSN